MARNGPVLLAIMAMLWAAHVPGSTLAMTVAERQALDLSDYAVTDRWAGYFDVGARREYLARTTDPQLLDEVEAHREGISCRQARSMPVLNHTISLPDFYEDRELWSELSNPFQLFEDAVSGLAAANLVAGDDYYANCLLDLLLDWAKADAFGDFLYDTEFQQAWYQIESSLFGSALALFVIGDSIQHRSEDLTVVTDWLARVARNHLAIEGGEYGSCCNNHFYRRALYATAVGILTQQDDLFRVGVQAIHSAVSDAMPDGALPLEMERGKWAAHYQNYAVMYLVMIAELIERQGYDAYSISYDGRTLHDLVRFNELLLQHPEHVLKHAQATVVSLEHLEDRQYYAWMEIYAARFDNETLDRIAAPMRPTYNRSLGGYLTLYFHVDD